MDQWHLVVGGISFAAGYWFRSGLDKPSEPQACHCQCQWTGPPPIAAASQGTGNFIWVVITVLVVCGILVLSNVALVCKVSFKDSSTGTDRELQFNVKGKSKGVYGASRGLAITG